MPALTRQEAQARHDAIRNIAYEIDLDLDRGDRHFGSTTTIRFDADAGADTWVDLDAHQVHSLLLNGVPLDPATLQDGRLALPGLAARNEFVVTATMAYSRDGQGLHRALDPADGRAYLYGHSFLAAAPRIFACFDQPDLKAPFEVTVTAPAEWIVLGNGAATALRPGRWRLATTPPLATYMVTVCAGPYASVRATHDGIPLGVHARASLRAELEAHAGQILDVTARAFDYFHALFGMRYAFGEYHQVFVPEFNAGAMENPGCVTLRDQYLFRGAATRSELLGRSNTVAHELAHMWFGDLVTMRWWDDLWLNESFAEYLAGRTLVAVTEFTDAWVPDGIARKTWGYAAERAPSAHPIAGVPALDAGAALQNFDGISYAKGAAALRQLIAYIGDDAFVTGIRAYLRSRAHGSATFADFLAALEEASGRSLEPWARAWLLTAGRDTLRWEQTVGADGRIASARLRRDPPALLPADRPHVLDVAGFDGAAETFRVPVVASSDVTQVPALTGMPAPRLVLPNASDLTWAALDLAPEVVAALPERLSDIPDPHTRAMVWTALEDGVGRGVIDPRDYLAVVAGAWPGESHSAILERVALGGMLPGSGGYGTVERFLPAAERPWGERLLADAALRVLAAEEPSLASGVEGAAGEVGDRWLIAARTLAGTTDDAALLRSWLAGEGLPEALRGDSDFRWMLVGQLARRGWLDVAGIQAERERDPSLTGASAALAARASLPDEEQRAWAWRELTSAERSNYELVALAQGFWRMPPLELVVDYAHRYFTDVPALSGRLAEDALSRVVGYAFPSVVDEVLLEPAREALARSDLTPAVRRALTDATWLMREVLRSRRRFPGPPPRAPKAT